MNISIIGVGMGNLDTITFECYKILSESDTIIASKRILSSLPEICSNIEKIKEVTVERIVEKIKELDLRNKENICIALSGDVGFYSALKSILELLGDKYNIKVFAGISSVQYMAAKLKRSWQNFKLVSAHGVDCNIISEVLNNKETFFLTGGDITPEFICKILCENGLGHLKIIVGERLSYYDEKITIGTAIELLGKEFEPLNTVIVENNIPKYWNYATYGIDDNEFIRGNVPMTKSEIRSIIISKLKIKEDDIIYDIGAGTGSVSIEMAMMAKNGSVYSIEMNEEGCKLIKENCEKFSIFNIKCIYGKAPEVIGNLEAPNAAFIGGSKGNLKEIVDILVRKNPNIRIVISAISLETLDSAMSIISEPNFKNIDISQISVSHNKKVGNYNMMIAQNPVFIISGEATYE